MNLLRVPSPLGELTVASDGARITALGMGKPPASVAAGTGEGSDAALDAARDWLDRYFSGARPSPRELPLAPGGTPFRRLVWDLLCEIPYGTTVTYGELAREAASLLGRERMAAQAIGGAVGHNPIPIIIPCHRVIGAGGDLVGFGCGLDRKIALLTHEGIAIREKKAKL